ncbi:MAG: zinc dependent phospholipase C family protein [Thermotogae bacterium]|nr:zinc dependent phospholipase C family protein [Thermotogota bacterium]
MPDILTHMIYGDRTLEKVRETDSLSLTVEMINWFHLGCQGPDPFFYYKFYLPKGLKKDIWKIGEKMHKEECGDVIINALRLIHSRMDNPDFISIAIPYIAGYISHFAIDRNAHPYIRYRSECMSTRVHEHNRFEKIVDVLMAKEVFGSKVEKLKINEKIYVGRKISDPIMTIYRHIFRHHFLGEFADIKPNVINSAYKDTLLFLRLEYSPLRLPYIFANFIDLITGYKYHFSAYFPPYKIDYKEDYMNESHREWHYPCNSNKKRNESLYELLNKGIEDGARMLTTAFDYLENRCSEVELKDAFPNISFSTGKPF